MESLLASKLFLIPVIAILVGLIAFCVFWNFPVVRQNIRESKKVKMKITQKESKVLANLRKVVSSGQGEFISWFI